MITYTVSKLEIHSYLQTLYAANAGAILPQQMTDSTYVVSAQIVIDRLHCTLFLYHSFRNCILTVSCILSTFQ